VYRHSFVFSQQVLLLLLFSYFNAFFLSVALGILVVGGLGFIRGIFKPVEKLGID